jgi:hypothetical protein
MQVITTIGLDIAKSVFQVHGVNAAGQLLIRRQLKRRYVLAFFQKQAPCLVGIEACASSHHWSRELQALEHTVRSGGCDWQNSGFSLWPKKSCSWRSRDFCATRLGCEPELGMLQRPFGRRVPQVCDTDPTG